MPVGDTMITLAVYQWLEKVGVNQDTDGARYVAFLVCRLENDLSNTLEGLYISAANRFGSTPQEVEKAVLGTEIEVYNTLTHATARFHPELREIMEKSFENNPFNIKITDKFLRGIMIAIEE